MLLRGMVDDEIHEQAYAMLFQLSDQFFDLLKRTVGLVDLAVIGDVIAHVNLRRFVACSSCVNHEGACILCVGAYMGRAK
jgi:hypothetical protein